MFNNLQSDSVLMPEESLSWQLASYMHGQLPNLVFLEVKTLGIVLQCYNRCVSKDV